MRRKTAIAVAILSIFSLVLVGGTSVVAGDKAEKKMDGAVVSTFEVSGMTCGGCSAGLRLNVKKLDGVSGVKVSHEDGMASITYDPELVTTKDIVKTIEKMGFTAKLEKTEKA